MTIRILCALLLLGSVVNAATESAPAETPAQAVARMKWWREARFGMFIHWGIYAVPADPYDNAGKYHAAEWYFNNKQKQVADYEPFAKQFNPTAFNASDFVKAAKDGGARYIVITSKHHDGFCMWDTKTTDYNIVKATPFGRDPMKELAEACREQGVKLCFYYSLMDWHHPDYLPRRKWEEKTRPTTTPTSTADMNRYIDYMKAQITELLTNYGPIGILWFDGEWEHDAKTWHSLEVNQLIRRLQPNIIINNRNRLKEDYETPEQEIPATGYADGRLWETCMTMNGTWGFAKDDHNWKSPQTLVHHLVDIASKGGNYLLNVGPDATGRIPQASVERLKAMGDWLHTNGDAIYGTSANPFPSLSFDGRCTTKDGTLYLHVFDFGPQERIRLVGLKTPIKAAEFLNGQEVEMERSTDETGRPVLEIKKPAKVDPLATVIAVHLAGPLKIDAPPTTSPANAPAPSR